MKHHTVFTFLLRSSEAKNVLVFAYEIHVILIHDMDSAI